MNEDYRFLMGFVKGETCTSCKHLMILEDGMYDCAAAEGVRPSDIVEMWFITVGFRDACGDYERIVDVFS